MVGVLLSIQRSLRGRAFLPTKMSSVIDRSMMSNHQQQSPQFIAMMKLFKTSLLGILVEVHEDVVGNVFFVGDLPAGLSDSAARQS